MKKYILFSLLIFILLFSGCGKKDNVNKDIDIEDTNVSVLETEEEILPIPEGEYIVKEIRENVYYKTFKDSYSFNTEVYYISIILEDKNQERYYYAYNNKKRDDFYLSISRLTKGDTIYFDGQFSLIK